MQPRILLSGIRNSTNYIHALTAAGMCVDAHYLPESPVSPETYADYDGLVFAGGDDIDPAYYGETISGARNINAERDAREMQLAHDFIRTGKPILGICRGFQLLNIVFGGSMVQHIDTAAQHAAVGDAVHTVTAEKGSFLHALYGSRFSVNSSHHQALKNIGTELRIICRSDIEGIPEAFVHGSLPIIGVQWHPERMCLDKRREDTVDGIEIFRYFKALCHPQGGN